MKSLIEFIYSGIIGIAVALFVGFSIWAVYPEPQYPTDSYPDLSLNYSANGQLDTAGKAKEDEYNKRFDQYDIDQKTYANSVAIVALFSGVIFYIIGIWAVRKNEVIGEGLLFGGVLVAVYSLIRSSSTFGDSDTAGRIIVFLSVTATLIMALTMTYLKFSDPTKKPVGK